MSLQLRVCFLAFSPFAFGLGNGTYAQEAGSKLPTSEFVVTKVGELPIILSAPHGGTKKIPNVPERKGEGLAKGGAGFSTAFDSNTDLLLKEISSEIEAKMGKKPYYLYATFSRKYIDANRPPEIAYENDEAKPVYEAYHKTLDAYCKEVKKKFGRGLVLDIHGQGTYRDKIVRGTNDGKSVKLLTDRFGIEAHTGPKSFFGLLAANEIGVYPEKLDGKEASGLNGGYIVQHYGANGSYGLDAIQMECGFDYRDKAKVKDAAKKIVSAIDGFAKLYLPEKPLEGK
jgi:N-formylglutamate amidohydrolase